MALPEPFACPDRACDGGIPWDWDRCPACGFGVAPPNVRWALDERDDLLRMYETARRDLAARGATAASEEFEAAVARSTAVLAMPIEFATLLFRRNGLHQNYYAGVEGGARIAAERGDDLMRRTVDAQIFGRLAPHITMAALSLDGGGLPSYGQVFVELKDARCRTSCSLLVRNSFDFVAAHPGGPAALPKGYRAAWQDRSKLAVVKLAGRLAPSTDPSDFAGLLLASTGDRATDDFVEVHLYGAWNHQAVGCVRGPVGSVDTFAGALLAELKDRVASLNIPWKDLP